MRKLGMKHVHQRILLWSSTLVEGNVLCPSFTSPMISWLNKSFLSIWNIHFNLTVKILGGVCIPWILCPINSRWFRSMKSKESAVFCEHTREKRAMAGNNRQKKSSFFSIFSIFKACCSPGWDDSWDEAGNYGRRICPSDEDRQGWVAEPGIDRKASEFIAKFYATRVSDPQTLAV